MAKKETWINTGLEVSQKIDIAGMAVGVGMIAFGIVGAGFLVAGTSAATYFAANEIQRRRK